MRARNLHQQGRTKQKFNLLCRWILCHFAHDKQTTAWSSLGNHATNWTPTEMFNYNWQIESVADSLTQKNSSDHVTRHVGIQNLTPEAGHNHWQNEIIWLQKSENSRLPWNLRNSIISLLWEIRMFNFLVNCAVRVFFLEFVVCINIQFFFLRPIGLYILCIQQKNECVPGRIDALWIHLW